jgi:hypothetical protein
LISLIWPPAGGDAANRAVSPSGARRYSAINIYTVYLFFKHFALKKQTRWSVLQTRSAKPLISAEIYPARFGVMSGANGTKISPRLATFLLAWQVCA